MAVNKFHINSQGVAKPCSANVRACRFGGDSTHFDTIEEAQKVAEQQLNEEFSHTPQSLTKKTNTNQKNNIQFKNKINKLTEKEKRFTPESLMKIGELFNNELANRVSFDIEDGNLTIDDYETLEKETHKLFSELIENGENLKTDVYGSLAKNLNNAVKILPNSVKNGHTLGDIPILAKAVRLDSQQFDGQHAGNSVFAVKQKSSGVAIGGFEKEDHAHLPDGTIYIKNTVFEDEINSGWGKRAKITMDHPEKAGEVWIGKKISGANDIGRKISDTTEVYLNGKMKTLNLPSYEIREDKKIQGSVILAKKNAGRDFKSESVLLHEYTHLVQMYDGTLAESNMFNELKNESETFDYNDSSDLKTYGGFPDEYMGLANGKELLTRSTEGFLKPSDPGNHFLYGKDKGKNAKKVRQWVMGYWLAKDARSLKINENYSKDKE